MLCLTIDTPRSRNVLHVTLLLNSLCLARGVRGQRTLIAAGGLDNELSRHGPLEEHTVSSTFLCLSWRQCQWTSKVGHSRGRHVRSANLQDPTPSTPLVIGARAKQTEMVEISSRNSGWRNSSNFPINPKKMAGKWQENAI
jgi:hypothetical protein